MGELITEKIGVGARDAVPHHETGQRESSETTMGRESAVGAGRGGEGGGRRGRGRGKSVKFLVREKAWGRGSFEGNPVFVGLREDERGREVCVEGGIDRRRRRRPEKREGRGR